MTKVHSPEIGVTVSCTWLQGLGGELRPRVTVTRTKFSPHLPTYLFYVIGALPEPSKLSGLPLVSAGLPLVSAGIPLPSSETPVVSSSAGNRSATGLIDSLAGGKAATSFSASALTNMLPMIGPVPTKSNNGVYIGEGLPPVPKKVADKITNWEFVDMWELLPEHWVARTLDEPGSSQRSATLQKRRQVTKIHSWVQCFAMYISVMTRTHPEAVPELLAYMIGIVRASQDFEGLAWLSYDTAFRRQAAATGNRRWSRLNPSMFSTCFTTAARSSSRCEWCLSSTHESKECPTVPNQDPDLGSRMKMLEAAILALTNPNTGATNRDECRLVEAEMAKPHLPAVQ